jgi:hypothetical protein
VLRNDQVDALADRFLRGITEEALGPGIPGKNLAVE